METLILKQTIRYISFSIYCKPTGNRRYRLFTNSHHHSSYATERGARGAMNRIAAAA